MNNSRIRIEERQILTEFNCLTLTEGIASVLEIDTLTARQATVKQAIKNYIFH